MDERDAEESRWGTWLLTVLGTALAVPLVVFTVYVALLHTAWGLDRGRVQLEELVSERIPGSMHIDELDNFDMVSPVGVGSVQVRGLVFRAPDGAEVIRIREADVRLDLPALLSRRVNFDRTAVRGGTVTLEPGARGLTKLENTFAGPKSTKSEDTAGPSRRPLSIEMGGIRARDMVLAVSPTPESFVELSEIEGMVGIYQARSAPGVTLRFDHVSAELSELSLASISGSLSKIDGVVQGKREQVVDLDFRASILNGEMKGRFEFFPKRQKKVRLSLDAGSLATEFAATAAKIRSRIGGDVTIDLE